ncbi:uncharacterized protein [Atheta coriaria]|uniref:uncharacterized protein isoform X3 n=1 Tax=Dalotia coriaria TaxID=877792 RepID=UPI0031F3F5F6
MLALSFGNSFGCTRKSLLSCASSRVGESERIRLCQRRPCVDSLLKTADQLKIKGLCDTPDEQVYIGNTSASTVTGEYPKLRRLSSPKHRPDYCDHKKTKGKKNDKAPAGKEPDAGTSTTTTTTTANDDDLHLHTEQTKENDRTLTARDDDKGRKRLNAEQNLLNMSSNALLTGQLLFSQFGVDNEDFSPDPPAPMAIPVGHVEMQEHSPTRTLLTNSSLHRTDLSRKRFYRFPQVRSFNFALLSDTHLKDIKREIKFETLHSSYSSESLLDIDSHMSAHSMDSHDGHDPNSHTTMMITPELTSLMPLGTISDHSMKSNGHSEHSHSSRHSAGPKTWTQEDMERALDALRNHNMSLTKASSTYGIPSTTLWQRAHRLGIDTPKKEGPTKSWTEESLNCALDALRTGTISANKASKAYGIPSSTLYKIARREGIRLAAPFNAAPTTWTPEDLEKALESIRSGQTSVQRASTEYGIPTGTLYGRCKREGIELSRSNPTPWSEDAMGEALEAVRLGHMSINQAAIHYNLPYSSLYGRFKRGAKYDSDSTDLNVDSHSQHEGSSMMLDYTNSHNSQVQYHNHTNS